MPAPTPSDPQDIIDSRADGLKLLDETLERLEKLAEKQEREGDNKRAQRTRHRIKRTKAVRAQRAKELELLRSGGELPKVGSKQHYGPPADEKQGEP